MASKSLKKNINLSRARLTIRHKVNRYVRTMSLYAVETLVVLTPVDTGRLRGNWSLGVDSINDNVDSDRMDKDGAATMARCQNDLSAGLGSYISIPNYVYVTNGIDYAKYVDARFGTVRIAVEQIKAFANVAGRGTNIGGSP